LTTVFERARTPARAEERWRLSLNFVAVAPLLAAQSHHATSRHTAPQMCRIDTRVAGNGGGLARTNTLAGFAAANAVQ